MNPMLIGALVQGASGLVGQLLSMNDQAKAEKLIEEATNEFGQLEVPKLEAMVAQEVGPSAYEKLQTDPRLKAAQFAALDRLERSATEGLTLDDKAAQAEALRGAARQESAGRARIADEFAARGQLGSGAQLAMQLQNQQAGAERAYDTSMKTAANSQRRMFDAMMQSGKMAGDLRNQEFGEQERIAQARDAVQRYNAGARQQAQSQNLQNQQWTYGAQRDRARDRLDVGRIRAGIAEGRAGQTQGMVQGFGNAATKGLQMYGASQQPTDEGEERRRVADWKSSGGYGGW